MQAVKSIYKHYRHALAQWPVDLLRPEVSFQKAMQQRIERWCVLPKTDYPDGETGMFRTPPYRSEADQVNVLYSFLEDRYMQKASRNPCTLESYMLIRIQHV